MILGAAARIRRTLYGAGLLRTERLPRPVVSVGNLVFGGAGKSPHVVHLARWLAHGGRRVAVLSRGYGRRTQGVVWASDGRGGVAAPEDAGDEPVMIARRLPSVPVLVGESRAAAGRAALSRTAVDVFLLDDGFQHLSLYRDVDILVVECGRGLGNGWTAPAGPLREPPSHARFADALVVTKCPSVEAGIRTADMVALPADRPRACSRYSPAGIVGPDGSPLEAIAAGARIFALSGIARNETFLRTLSEAGYDVQGCASFPDHHAYGRGDLARIAKEAGPLPVVTTEKDLVRLPSDLPFAVGALRIEVEYLFGWEEMSRWILSRLEREEAR